MHDDGRVFWARRVRRDGWQFPQGGMNSDETPTEAMYRELCEETGLLPEHVDVVGSTPGWLRYRLPHRDRRQTMLFSATLNYSVTEVTYEFIVITSYSIHYTKLYDFGRNF